MRAVRIRGMRPPIRDVRRDNEGGFVMAFFAMVLVTLIIFTGFAVDVGAWYARGAQVQRAADAAALAGVVWMPDFEVASEKALEAAARNGFVHGQNNITVQPERVPGNNRQLRVTIWDNDAPIFFSGVVLDNQKIGRKATAEYVLPVPMGSPKNFLGTGDLMSGANKENFWAAVNGYCAGHESGDKKLARYESYTTSSHNGSRCNNGSALATDYDPDGYLYAINVPTTLSSLTVQAYDAAYYRSGSPRDMALGSGGNQSVTTIFEIYGRNPTPLDLSNLPLARTVTLNTNASGYQNQWQTLHTFNGPVAPGQYYVRVRTPVQATESRASNGFGLRVYSGSSFAACTTVVGDPGYSATCPQIHAISDLSIFANIEGSSASFHLAEVDKVHAGKTMRVKLFDAGEGASRIEILDPNGNPATFSWSTACNPPTPPTGGCGQNNVNRLDVLGTGTQPFTGLQSNSKYNNRSIVLDIKLPNNYEALYGTKTWWKVRYTTDSAPTDRTTWSVNIVGDPVHLVG